MIRFFYQTAVKAYGRALRAAALFHPKARLWVEGRKGWREKLEARMAPVLEEKRPVAWFHAASLGEFEQGRPVIEAFRAAYPEYFIILTFFSPSGYEVRRNYAGADYTGYLPEDTARNARDFVALTKPGIAFFIKYEFWHHYLSALKAEGTFLVSFAATFRKEQLFFKQYGSFYRKLLFQFDVILVQDRESERLLEGIGLRRQVRLGGDTRFDRVAQSAGHAVDLPEVARFCGLCPCLVVGSAWPADMDVLIPVLNGLGERLKVIIAPHEIHPVQIGGWISRLEGHALRYSDYRAGGFRLPDPAPDYLIIDNVGMLSALYRYGHFAYIGGGFGAGLHNILEAVTFGLPVFFGNRNYRKFPEAVALQELGAARVVAGAEPLVQGIRELLDNPELLREKSQAGVAYVRQHTGATGKVMQAVADLLGRPIP